MDDAEADVLAYMAFPAQHRSKLHSTDPLERLNKEVKRRQPGATSSSQAGFGGQPIRLLQGTAAQSTS